MHRGITLATLMCALVTAALGLFPVMEPLFVRSQTVTLRNASGAGAVCAASFAPANEGGRSPEYAVAICTMSCEEQGFKVVKPGDDLAIDFVSKQRFRWAQYRWRSIIPAACKDDRTFPNRRPTLML